MIIDCVNRETRQYHAHIFYIFEKKNLPLFGTQQTSTIFIISLSHFHQETKYMIILTGSSSKILKIRQQRCLQGPDISCVNIMPRHMAFKVHPAIFTLATTRSLNTKRFQITIEC